MKHRIDVLEKEKLELKKELNELFKENENICNLLCRIEKEEQYGPPTLDEVIIEDLLKNMHISKYRRTYSSTLLSIGFILLSYSPITYRKLTELLPFPSEKTIRDKFKSEMKTTSENLLNINQLKIILHELHKFYTSDDEEEIVASIAIDAAAMKPTQS